MRTILAFFGYVKVPRAAVELSIRIEVTLKAVSRLIYPDTSASLEAAAHDAETLTEFLRSGRLLNRE